MTGPLSPLLLLFLVVSAIAVARTKDLISAVIIFAAYSLVMAIIWQQLQAPDIAITEAAIGAGVTTLLFLAAISRTRRFEE
ncbi:MAG: hydrogenase subunit MbhD domain-containing protein [Bacillota bacterium]